MTSDQKQLILTIITAVAIGALGFFFAVWLLSPFFSGSIQLPQSFGVGGLRIQVYGLLLGLGAFAGYLLAMRRKEKFGVANENADNIILVSIITGFVGARIYHVISEFGFYLQYPGQIVAVWNGGLSIFGAAIGAVLGIYLYWKYFLNSTSGSASSHQYSFLNLLDWLTPSIIVGQIIGRFGNFVNYELYGYPTNFFWKMFVPQPFRIPPYELSQFFHPLFLYEAAGSAIILVIVLKLKMRTGMLFLTWLLLYNVMRFFLEFMRAGSIVYGGVRVNAIFAATLVVLTIALIYKLRNRKLYVQQNSSSN